MYMFPQLTARSRSSSSSQIASGATVSEVEVDEKLTARRKAQPGFNDCSFPTIAGALWYRPPSVSAAYRVFP